MNAAKHRWGLKSVITQRAYTPFSYDVSKFFDLKTPADVEILVAVDSTPNYKDQPEPYQTAWWYDGGGIYRSVQLFKVC